MKGSFIESLENRAFFSASMLNALSHPDIAEVPVIIVPDGTKAPSLVGNFSGVLNIPGIHARPVTLSITSQTASGKFRGTLNSLGIVSVNVTGTMTAKGTFKIKMTGSHVGGPVNGTGTGKLAGAKVTMRVVFQPGGFPGSLTLTKA